jgi:glycolate oxidase iron-sulfur subunit
MAQLVSPNLQTTFAQQEQKLVACIHCGLCLESCPTYVITGDENDGPRGRLYLMRAVAEGRLENTSTAFSKHINRCLGCRACESVCPAGVEYGQLLEASREELISAQPKDDFTHKALRFALKHVWPSRRRLSFFFAVSRIFRNLGLAKFLLYIGVPRLISKRAEFAMALLDSSRPVNKEPEFSPGEQTDLNTSRVMMFMGCAGEGLFRHVNRATQRVLRANGFSVEQPAEQVCCGALHAHAGDLEGAKTLARTNIAAFADTDATIITNAGGCGAMLESYGHLLANDDEWSARAHAFSLRIRDVGEKLKEIVAQSGSEIGSAVVTYDSSCHLLYGQHAAEASRDMLQQIPGLPFVSLEGSERCCGGAGIYNLLQPELSARVLREKLTHIATTKAEVLATGNPGCQMQIGAGAKLAGMKLRVCHPVELLDESYERAGLYK